MPIARYSPISIQFVTQLNRLGLCTLVLTELMFGISKGYGSIYDGRRRFPRIGTVNDPIPWNAIDGLTSRRGSKITIETVEKRNGKLVIVLRFHYLLHCLVSYSEVPGKTAMLCFQNLGSFASYVLLDTMWANFYGCKEFVHPQKA